MTQLDLKAALTLFPMAKRALLCSQHDVATGIYNISLDTHVQILKRQGSGCVRAHMGMRECLRGRGWGVLGIWLE